MLFGINHAYERVIDLHQGAPAVRDIGLLLMVLLLIEASRRSGKASVALVFAGTFIAGISIFFAYNRGLTALVAVGVYVLASLVAGACRKTVAAAIAGVIAGLGVLVLLEPGMALTHLANIGYWARHREIWAYDGPFLRISLFYALAALTLLGAAWFGWQSWRGPSRPKFIPILATLAAICALVLQQGAQRPDYFHLGFAMPWLFLLTLWMTNGLSQPEAGSSARPLVAAGYFLTLLAAMYSPFTRAISGASLYNVGLLHGPVPKDEELVGGEVRAVANVLHVRNPACTYTLNNAAGLYELSSRKPCSVIMVPVYAAGEAETRLIADLARTRPPVIVSRSDDVFNAIDGRTLEARTPRLSGWVKANYPHVFRMGSYELRSASTLTAMQGAPR